MPKKRKLNTQQKTQLRRASADAIEAQMLSVAKYLKASQFLPTHNGYFYKTAHKVALQAKRTPPKFKKRSLGEYIAISCTLHCIDGWSYLARAFSSLVQGDSAAARHFGYYAELRAAMALLASQGTGLFNRHHVIVDKKGVCHPYNGPGTHEAVWMFLEHWGERKAANAVLETIVKPGSRPLADWIDAFAVGTVTPKLIAQQWCKIWGLDLKRLSKDRDSRNESSYRPTQLQTSIGVSAHVTAGFIAEFWRLFRPWPPNFGVLDAHLLRKILHNTFISATGKSVNGPAFSEHISQAISQIQPSGMSVSEWKSFLAQSSEPMLLAFAGKSDGPDDAQHHMQVISRAALLLRLASGTSEKLLNSAYIERHDINFWSSRFGVVRGIWNDGEQPDNMLDLWQDIEEAVYSIDSWNTARDSRVSYSEFRKQQVAPLQVLCECERIALWSIAT
jgi:hypothetical protein